MNNYKFTTVNNEPVSLLQEEITSSQLSNNATPSENKSRVLIVGAGQAGLQIARELTRRKNASHTVVGFVDDDYALSIDSEFKVLGTRKEIVSLIEQYHIDEVIIAYVPSWQQWLAEQLINQERDVRLKMVPGLYEAMIGKPQFSQIHDVPLLDFSKYNPSRSYLFTKRLFDLSFSLFALMITMPVTVVSALLIKLTSQGPILYSQERIGKDGRPFLVYKLRTMVVDAEVDTGPTLSTGESDHRVTPIGRILRALRLDEIPQFYNVLRGDMSVVGPRPERPCFVDEFAERIPSYHERHRVLPGITGLAQVYGFYQTHVYTKLKYDLIYIYNQSIFQDLKIMALTVKVLIGAIINKKNMC